jgi:hypothetical protein
VIFLIFTKWAHRELAQDEADRLKRQQDARAVDTDEELTFEQVAERFEQTAAPSEDR